MDILRENPYHPTAVSKIITSNYSIVVIIFYLSLFTNNTIPKTTMLLDEHLTMYHRPTPSRNVDWIFSLIGFFFLFIAFVRILYCPIQYLEFFCWGGYYVIPLFSVLIFVAFSFFLVGGLYALFNRILKIPIDYKLGMLHLVFSFLTVSILLWKISDDGGFMQFSLFDVFNSMMSLASILIFVQFIFLINALLGMIKRSN